MLQRRTFRIAALVLGPALAVGACSSGGNPFSNTNDFDRTFIAAAQTWDLNKDGVVTCDEWLQYLATSFREADKNGDGALDATEWAHLVSGDRLFDVAKLPYYDANGDGRVTLEEMQGTHNVAFKLLDRNQDCQIDRTEIVQVHGVDKVKPAEGGGAPDTSSQRQGPMGR